VPPGAGSNFWAGLSGRVSAAPQRELRARLDRRQRALQLVDVFDFDGEVHGSDVVARLRFRRDHVGLLPHQRFGHVAQQPLPVVSADDNVHGVGLGSALAPIGADDAFGKALGEAREARAVAAMHETPRPLVTNPEMRSGGAGLQQRASCVSRRSTPTTRTPLLDCPAGARCGGISCECGALGTSAQRGLQLPRPDFLAPDRREKLLGLVETESLRQVLEARGAFAFALQFALNGSTTCGHHARDFAAVEPLAHLVARARALYIAERGIEPVAARASDFGGNDLDSFRILQPVVEGTIAPFTLAPRQRCPMSVCSAYAKSTGVAPWASR